MIIVEPDPNFDFFGHLNTSNIYIQQYILIYEYINISEKKPKKPSLTIELFKERYNNIHVTIYETGIHMPIMETRTTQKTEGSTLPRVTSGIEGLDTVIQGGFPKGTTTLISGPPGGGKTILCYHFLYQGMKQGEKCLFLTLDKKVEGLLIQANELGLDFQSGIENGTVKFLFLNINKKLIYETMTNEILQGEYDRIVLDSITPLSEMPIYIRDNQFNRDINVINSEDHNTDGNFPIRRLHLHYIMNALETSQSTSLVTSELPVGTKCLSRDGISEFLADGVIVLSVDPTMDRRKISVVKMRSTQHTLKPQDIRIGKGGMTFV